MDTLSLIALLSLITLVCVFVFARISKRKVEARRHDEHAQKSTLATDSPGKSAVEAMEDK